jgi:hypothetical protein
MFTMKSEMFGQPSVVSVDVVQSVYQKICERRRFTITELSCEFPQISRTLLYENITVRLGYHHKFCARWVPKMLTGAHKTQRMALALTCFRSLPQKWRWISQSHRASNRWWNLDIICEYRNKEQSNRWMHTHSATRWRMVELYLHSPICLHGEMHN